MHTSHTHTHTHTHHIHSHNTSQTHTLSSLNLTKPKWKSRSVIAWISSARLLQPPSSQLRHFVSLSLPAPAPSHHAQLHKRGFNPTASQPATHDYSSSKLPPIASQPPQNDSHHNWVFFFFNIELWNWIICDWNGYGIELYILNSVCVDYNPQNLLRL